MQNKAVQKKGVVTVFRKNYEPLQIMAQVIKKM